MMADKKNALETHEELQAEARKAEAKIGELEAEAKKLARAPERAKGELRGYFAEVESGSRKADAKTERQLIDAIHKAEAKAPVEADRMEAKINAARETAQIRHGDVVRHIEANREELTAALLPLAEAAKDRLAETRDLLDAAAGEWGRVRNLWQPLIERWGVPAYELPPNPLSGASEPIDRALAPFYGGKRRDPRRLWPAPASVIPGDYEEFDGPKDPNDDGMVKKPMLASQRGMVTF